MMKKVKILCVVLLLLMLFGCSGSMKQIKTREKNSMNGYMNYEILYSQLTHKIEPAITEGYYTYYKPKNTSDIFVDLVMKVENTSDKELAVKDLKGVFHIADEDYTAEKVIEKDDTTLSKSATIPSQETRIVHMYTEVSMKTNLTEDIQFIFTAHEEKAQLTYKINDFKEAKNYQKKGYTFKDDRAEIQLDKVTFTDQVKPAKPSTYYHYYQADNGKTLVALKVSIKNIGKEDLSTSRLIGAKIFVDGTEYSAGLVIEDNQQANLDTSVIIKTGKTHTGYFIGEIKEADKAKEIEVCIYYAGQKIYIKK